MTPYHLTFLPILLLGCLIAGAISLLAATRPGCLLPGFLFVIGVFVVWAALFLGSDMGYRAWQSMPDPPDEAFSDASVLGALILGWVPGVVFCAAVFVVGRSIRWLLRRANPVVVQNDSPFQSPTTDSGNPYQSPRS